MWPFLMMCLLLLVPLNFRVRRASPKARAQRINQLINVYMFRVMFRVAVVAGALGVVQAAPSAAPATASKVPATAASILSKHAGAPPPQQTMSKSAGSSGPAGAIGGAAQGGAAGAADLDDVALLEDAWGATTNPALTPADILQTLGITGGSGPAQASAVKGGSGRAHQQEMAAMKRLLLQLEARIRTLEACAMTSMRIRADYPAVAAALIAADAYYEAAGVAPDSHGLGAPQPLVFAAFMQRLASTPLPPNADSGIEARMVAVLLLVLHIMGSPFEAIPLYLNHFAVARLPPTQDGTVYATVSFSIEGTLSLPSAQQLEDIKAQANAAFASKSWETVRAQINNCFTVEDGAPLFAGVRGFSVERVLVTILSFTGATKSGRLARGGAARAVAGKGGKGKGGKGKQA